MIQEKYIEEYKTSQEVLRYLREIEAKMKESQRKGNLRVARLELVFTDGPDIEKEYVELSPTIVERAINQQHTAVYNRVETLDKLIAEDLRK